MLEAGELNYRDFQALIEDLSTPLPYGDPTMRVFIDVVAFVLGGLDLLPPERRTATDLLLGLQIAGMSRLQQAVGAPRSEEYQGLLIEVLRKATLYQHQRLQDMGQPLPQCSWEPPCRFHPQA